MGTHGRPVGRAETLDANDQAWKVLEVLLLFRMSPALVDEDVLQGVFVAVVHQPVDAFLCARPYTSIRQIGKRR